MGKYWSALNTTEQCQQIRTPILQGSSSEDERIKGYPRDHSSNVVKRMMDNRRVTEKELGVNLTWTLGQCTVMYIILFRKFKRLAKVS